MRTPYKRGQRQRLEAPVATSMHLENVIKCHSSRRVFFCELSLIFLWQMCKKNNVTLGTFFT